MSDSDMNGKLAQFLTNHPRLLGVLFGLVVLLTQGGAAIAQECANCSGP